MTNHGQTACWEGFIMAQASDAVPARTCMTLTTQENSGERTEDSQARPSLWRRRLSKNIFFGPQEVSHCSLWTISERNDTQTAAWACLFCFLVSYTARPSFLVSWLKC